MIQFNFVPQCLHLDTIIICTLCISTCIHRDNFNQVLQLYKDREPTRRAEVHTLLGKVYSKQLMCEDAEKHYKEALQILSETNIPTILVSL